MIIIYGQYDSAEHITDFKLILTHNKKFLLYIFQNKIHFYADLWNYYI